ncbi:hypothetical protein Slin15195_G024310 [Septoria linicola]|uniref:Uncharacterized protein n=1 Tax=Septoria linicola TaxID=215465 RepID=A0A9Q9EGR5_9PEZI|nr:hypothetical protein Slin14017_G023400 [Septoria linicola]USW49112.1 hypothetical protein Slin15195_G024310 [Septoria linicola]
MAQTLAIYLLITRELAEEAKMPTNFRYWNGTEQVSDAALLAEFMLWLAVRGDCANEAFNFANGDHFTWRFMWPRLAETFRAYSTPDQIFSKAEPAMGELRQEFSLARWAADKKPLWCEMCDATGTPEAKDAFDCAAWQSLDESFQRSWTCNVSMSKAREYGWSGFKDSFDSFSSAFADLKTQRKIF